MGASSDKLVGFASLYKKGGTSVLHDGYLLALPAADEALDQAMDDAELSGADAEAQAKLHPRSELRSELAPELKAGPRG